MPALNSEPGRWVLFLKGIWMGAGAASTAWVFPKHYKPGQSSPIKGCLLHTSWLQTPCKQEQSPGCFLPDIPKLCCRGSSSLPPFLSLGKRSRPSQTNSGIIPLERLPTKKAPPMGGQQVWGKDCSTAGESHNSQDTCGPSLKMPRWCPWSVKFPQMQQETGLAGSSETHKVEEEQHSIFEKRVYTQASSI